MKKIEAIKILAEAIILLSKGKKIDQKKVEEVATYFNKIK